MTMTASQPDLHRVAPAFVERVPIQFARRHGLLGLQSDAPGVIEIAAADERLRPLVENLALILDCETRLLPVDAALLPAAITAAYAAADVNVDQAVLDLAAQRAPSVEDLVIEGDLLDRQSRAPVIQLVNLVLFEAVRRRASDVHIHPGEAQLAIRFRVDGVLSDYQQVPQPLQDEIVSRIKVLGGMDIAEKRLPQDGRATVRIGSRLIDLRLACLPTVHGERVVIRLLDKGARRYELAELGLAPQALAQLEGLIQRSHGIFLLTGPTGAGKSTTLYAALQRVNYRELNVVTLEDPIEYDLPGISQTQISNRKGLTFAAGLRSLLRQDPDVIMVGEIRDEETARLAIQSALTGHLVLSTLHTNDSVGAVARLLDLGLEPYLVADALLGVGAQRLVRVVCPTCASPTPLPESEREALGLTPDVATYQQGAGCDACNGSGFCGRVALFELFVVDDEARRLIHGRAPAGALRAAAQRAGMQFLRAAGGNLVRSGTTTPAEVLRVTQTGAITEEETDAPVRV